VPGTHASDFYAYNAAEVALLAGTDVFVAENLDVGFDVVNINHDFVIGKNELVLEAKDITLGTGLTAFWIVLGSKKCWCHAVAEVG